MRDHTTDDEMQNEDGADTGALDLKLDTLSGDIRDAMLTRFKQLPNTWNFLSQAEQYDQANGLELLAKQLVRRAVALLTKHEFPHAVITLAEFKVKGSKDIEAKITCQNIEVNREALGNHVGDMCMLVMVDSETFFGERAPVKTDPDQPGLDLDGDGEDDPAEEDDRLALPPPDDEGQGGQKPNPEDLE